MEKEVIFNIFPICNKGVIINIGFRTHEITGTDEEKIDFLLSRIEEDVKEIKTIKVPDNYSVVLPDGTEINAITHERFNSLIQNGTDYILYEAIFNQYNASKSPLLVSTMVIDGKIKIDGQSKF